MTGLQTRLTLCVFLAVGAPAVLGQAQAGFGAGETKEIRMTARKYRFDPAVITVKKGQRVRLLITAIDHDHGFELDAFNINQKLKKGDPATVEFTADRAGTFYFHCSHFCGLGHPKMKGKIVVEEQ